MWQSAPFFAGTTGMGNALIQLNGPAFPALEYRVWRRLRRQRDDFASPTPQIQPGRSQGGPLQLAASFKDPAAQPAESSTTAAVRIDRADGGRRHRGWRSSRIPDG